MMVYTSTFSGKTDQTCIITPINIREQSRAKFDLITYLVIQGVKLISIYKCNIQINKGRISQVQDHVCSGQLLLVQGNEIYLGQSTKE